MTKGYQHTGEGVKSLYGAPTEEQLDALEWAKDFMDRYEKKHGFEIKNGDGT